MAGVLGSTNGIGTNSQFWFPRDIILPQEGVYALVTDFGNHLIRRIIVTTAFVTTLAGVAGSAGSTDGIGTNSRFWGPVGISLSPSREYALIADELNHLIRYFIISTASVMTLAGVAGSRGSTNGIGTDARFGNPIGVVISPNGVDVLVSELWNHLIRKITLNRLSSYPSSAPSFPQRTVLQFPVLTPASLTMLLVS